MLFLKQNKKNDWWVSNKIFKWIGNNGYKKKKKNKLKRKDIKNKTKKIYKVSSTQKHTIHILKQIILKKIKKKERRKWSK